MKKIIPTLFLSIIVLSACSSTMMDSRQVVHVQTSPNNVASCQLTDTKTTYTVNAPGIVEVNQGDGPLSVSCQDGVSSGSITVQEKFNTDAIWGEKPGMLLDTITGSYQKYDREITVPLSN